MSDAIDPADRLEALLDNAEPRLARVFMAAIRQLKDELDLGHLEDLLARGQFEEALSYTQEIARAVGHESNVVFMDAGQSTATFLSGLDLGTIRFDVVNDGAVRAMKANTFRIDMEFSEEQRRATNAALVAGIERGQNPREQARTFRDSIGLTERQQAAVDNYRRMLEEGELREAKNRRLSHGQTNRTLEARIKNKKPLTPAQIDMMTERYRANYIKYRSEVIARTEALRAVHEGNEEGYRQAIEAGKLFPERLIRAWDSSRDNRVRFSHKILHGQKRNWGEAWDTPHGPIRYPGDPDAALEETIQCRCLLTTRIKDAG